MKEIGNQCFEHCKELVAINLHETCVESIGASAFLGCVQLTTLNHSSNSRDVTGKYLNVANDSGIVFPLSMVKFGDYIFQDCIMLPDEIDANMVHYTCDLNRGGKRFLHRNHDDYDRSYPSSLWPYIFYRIMNQMELPKHNIIYFHVGGSNYLYTDRDSFRRASVAYHMMIHGAAMDVNRLDEE